MLSKERGKLDPFSLREKGKDEGTLSFSWIF